LEDPGVNETIILKYILKK